MLGTHHNTTVRGVSAVETVVGVSLIALVLIFSAQAITLFLRSGASAVDRTKALYLTEELLESARFVSDKDWSDFEDLALDTDLYVMRNGTNMSIITSSQTIDGFTPRFRLYAVRRDAVSDDIVSSGGVVDSGTRLMIATTTFGGESVSLSQYVMDMSP